MNSRRTIVPACASLLVAALVSGLPASAAEWAVWKGHDQVAPHAIYTTGTDETGAILACDAKGELTAMLSLEPASLTDLMARNARYARSTDGTLAVGSDMPAETTFRYTPANKTIETKSHGIAAKVFNSAVLGEPLKVETKREGSIEAQLPAPNDAFKAFAKTCSNLRNANDA